MFEAFEKIPRLLNMPMIISEKLDGTNASVVIDHRANLPEEDWKYNLTGEQWIDGSDLFVLAGSRTRYITPGSDNFGFAIWVQENWKDLITLGPGKHFGEWWGRGIQRCYNLKEKRFSLFNTGRWSNPETRPKCVSAVPVLYYGQFSQAKIEELKADLLINGSRAAPGFQNPEGVVIYLPKANLLFKSTYNDTHKGEEV